MALLQQPIQRKLSALLGAEVTFDKLNLSLLGGTIEAAGMTVTTADKTLPPILTIGRIKAHVSVGRAFRGEIVVKSLAIERPVVHFVRRNGRTNLPVRDGAPEADDAAEATTPDEPPDEPHDEKPDKTSWKFDVEKVLIVDGEATVQLDGRDFDAKPVLAELKRVGDDAYEVTLLSDAVSHVGQVRGNGRITGAGDLAAIADARMTAELHLGEFGSVKFSTPKMRSDEGEISVAGAITIGRLMALIGK